MTERTYVAKKNMSHYPLGKGEGSPATHLDIELTERCNNACIHCCINRPVGDKRSRARELDTNAWKDILRQAAGLGVMTVRFTGGSRCCGMTFPNSTFLHVAWAEGAAFHQRPAHHAANRRTLGRYPPLEDIEISVYGMRKESYEAATGVDGSYAGSALACNVCSTENTFRGKRGLLPPNKMKRRNCRLGGDQPPDGRSPLLRHVL